MAFRHFQIQIDKNHFLQIPKLLLALIKISKLNVGTLLKRIIKSKYHLAHRKGNRVDTVLVPDSTQYIRCEA
jgi:hypothetical protein